MVPTHRGDDVNGLMTDLAAERVLDGLLGGRRVEPPAVVEVGLSLAPANAAGLVVEPAHPSYARAVVPNDADHFPSAGNFGGIKSNARLIEFARPTGPWGLIKSVFVAEPGGPVVLMVDLGRPRRVDAAYPRVTIDPGSLACRLY